jgi:hypothetical protein
MQSTAITAVPPELTLKGSAVFPRGAFMFFVVFVMVRRCIFHETNSYRL